MQRPRAAVLVAPLAAVLVALLLVRSLYAYPWDLSVNYVAAHAVARGVPLYDLAAMRALAAEVVPAISSHPIYVHTYTSYLSSPPVAVLLAPLALLPFEAAALAYRLALLGAHALTVALLGLAVAPGRRRVTWATGAACLLLWQPASASLSLGQTTAWALLALAAAALAARWGRWGWAGAAIAVAALVKVSPALLLGYCVLIGRWRALAGAAGVGALALLLAWAPGQGRDLAAFVAVALPAAGGGTAYRQNAALPAALARVADPARGAELPGEPLGPWRLLSLTIAGGGLLVARWRRAELAALIPVVVLAGPIAWDHYLTWLVVPVALLAAQGRVRPALVALGAALAVPPLLIPELAPAATLGVALLALRHLPMKKGAAEGVGGGAGAHVEPDLVGRGG